MIGFSFVTYRRPLLWTAVLVLLAGSGAPPARADGGVVEGTFTLLLSGDTAEKIDLVFLGDGFTSAQQNAFNARVDEAVAAFMNAHPLQALRSAFNIHRVNVSSPESGTDKFATCGGEDTGDSDVSRRTAMDSGYCNGGNASVYRCMGSSDHSLAQGFAANAPDDDIVIVLVNDGGHGGCAFGGITFFTLTSSFADIVVHELGHAVFGLADEYRYDGDDIYPHGEPGAPNVTIGTNRVSLKWRDLVLPSTAIPTQNQAPNCGAGAGLPDRNVDADLVGTFESASYSRCGIFRPQHACRMRESDQQFCSVCRRAVIRRLAGKLSGELSVFFDTLLIRDDHDGWGRGKGDIYFNYILGANGQQVSGRWPASGDSGFGDGDSREIAVFAGTIPAPAPGTEASLDVKVRDGDWPDGDDDLASDAIEPLPAAGSFSVDKSDYRLNGTVRDAELRVLLDQLNVKDDRESFPAGDGDIFVEYTISNGSESVSGRWPSSGTQGIGDHDSAHMKVLAATLPVPTGSAPLSVRLRVVDDDGWLTGGDDEIGQDTFTFTAGEDFGATATTHVRDQSNYRLTLSIVRRLTPPVPIGRAPVTEPLPVLARLLGDRLWGVRGPRR